MLKQAQKHQDQTRFSYLSNILTKFPFPYQGNVWEYPPGGVWEFVFHKDGIRTALSRIILFLSRLQLLSLGKGNF